MAHGHTSGAGRNKGLPGRQGLPFLRESEQGRPVAPLSRWRLGRVIRPARNR
jgi:hypothetical protein